ncbi:MAG: phage tail protein [Acidobacteriota bacterium]
MDELWLGFRFDVFFFPGADASGALDARSKAPAGGVDLRFQSVKGLGAVVATGCYPEGGQNLYAQRLPTGVDYEPLVLERGLVVDSALDRTFDEAMGLFKFSPSNVLVSLLNEAKDPVSAWLFQNAYPLRWATSDLDAGAKRVVVDTLELAYSRIQRLEV